MASTIRKYTTMMPMSTDPSEIRRDGEVCMRKLNGIVGCGSNCVILYESEG